MFYRIANSLIEIKGLQNEYIERRMSAYMATGKHTTPDITVTFIENTEIEVPTGRDFRRLDAWYWIKKDDGGFSAVKQNSKYRFNLMRMDFDESCENVTIEYYDLDGLYSDFTTEYLLHVVLGEAIAFCQTVRGNTVLHSAAASYKGQAMLFSAPSETGKSTHTSLWKKYYPDDVVLFNDDTPIITEIDNKFYACGTPWSGKTEINENEIFPLKSIVFLKQGKENSIRPLSTIEAVVRLINETKKPVFEHLMDMHMEIITNIIKNVPIYELTCNISKEAVDLVKKTVFEEE